MKWPNPPKKVDYDFVIIDYPFLINNARTNTQPPYSEEEIKKIFYFSFLYCKFLQENNLVIRKLVDTYEDIQNVVIKKTDFTDEGRYFNVAIGEKFENLSNFNVDPHKRVDRILVKGLKQMRELHERGEINYVESKT